MTRLSAIHGLVIPTALLSCNVAYASGAFSKAALDVMMEVQNDHTYKSDRPGSVLNDLYTKIEGELTVSLSENFSFFALGVLEAVEDPAPSADRAFGGHGLLAEEIFVTYEQDNWAIKAGKFAVNFGRAWEDAPGFYANDMAEDNYKTGERLGAEIAVELGRGHIARASLFTADRSFLSNSALTARGRTQANDGGLSNTGKLDSFAITLEGPLPEMDALSYHVSVMRQAGGVTENNDEKAFAFALSTAYPINGGWTFSPFAEIIYQTDAAGLTGTKRLFATGAFGLEKNAWNINLSNTIRHTHNGMGLDFTDTQFQISAGRRFENNLAFDVGWKWLREKGQNSYIFGALMTYQLSTDIF